MGEGRWYFCDVLHLNHSHLMKRGTKPNAVLRNNCKVVFASASFVLSAVAQFTASVFGAVFLCVAGGAEHPGNLLGYTGRIVRSAVHRAVRYSKQIKFFAMHNNDGGPGGVSCSNLRRRGTPPGDSSRYLGFHTGHHVQGHLGAGAILARVAWFMLSQMDGRRCGPIRITCHSAI